MRLTRLRLSQIRQFSGSLEIPSFEPGLNLFSGPNEAGKSTIVRAIRAAFFERYRSGVVEDLIPRGGTPTSASPTVEISFEIGGTPYTLTKTFFVKKRCALAGGARTLDGDEAEEAVARLLGFSYAGKGLSKQEHWGIPGLLWIEQGESHQVAESVQYAANQLRTALESTVGAVASSAGDEVLAAIRLQRERVLTPTSRPRGEYELAIAEVDAARDSLGALERRIQGYQEAVDQLADLRQRHEADERSKPWESFRTQLSAAEAALGEAQQLQGRLQTELEAAQRLEQTVRILDEQVRGFATLREDLDKREHALRTAIDAENVAKNTLESAEKTKVDAQRSLEATAAAVAVAEREEVRGEQTASLSQATADEERLTAQLRDAEEDGARVVALEAAAKENIVAAEDLTALESLEVAVQKLEATQQAAATSLIFDLAPGVDVTLDGTPVERSGERRVTTKAVVTIFGVGSIIVEPGAGDLAKLRERLAAARADMTSLQIRLGVAGLDEARARQHRADQAKTEATAARRLLTVRAPRGVEALRAELAQVTARKAAASESLRKLPPRVEAPALDVARVTHESAQTAFKTASERVVEAGKQLADRTARRESAERESQRLRDIVNEPGRGAKEKDASKQLDESKQKLAASTYALSELQSRVSQARPELLKQDVQRLSASADRSLKAFHQREADIRGLLGRLENEGALGLEEQRAQLKVTLEAASRRLAEIRLRADALELLVARMEEKREALTRRLQAPLQTRLDHYVRILFPQSRMELKEDLTPGALTRATETIDFVQLSYGAKEQAALVSRLAYADLLKEAGSPTLLMLDDALVHSDAVRLEQMKRVIFDGATRHQILLFTCHPERWEGSGATARDVRSFAR
jgi:hypothetical protein